MGHMKYYGYKKPDDHYEITFCADKGKEGIALYFIYNNGVCVMSKYYWGNEMDYERNRRGEVEANYYWNEENTQKLLLRTGTHNGKDMVKAIYERFEGTTWYLQKVLNQLYATTDHAATDDVERAVTQIIRQNEEAYKDTLFQLTARQRDLLVAIGQEGKASQITGMQFVKRHHLSSASSVQKAAQALLEKQLITQQQNIYEVYDKFMAEWLRFQL